MSILGILKIVSIGVVGRRYISTSPWIAMIIKTWACIKEKKHLKRVSLLKVRKLNESWRNVSNTANMTG